MSVTQDTVDIMRSMKQEGRLLILTMSLQSEGITLSKDYNIHNMFSMRFKATRTNDGYVTSLYTSIKKHEATKDMIVVLDMTSDPCNFSNPNIPCTEVWRDWKMVNANKIIKGVFKINLKIKVEKIPSLINTKLYYDDTFTDFTLSAKDGSVAVHRAYLAAHSDTFATMFHGQWKETKENHIELKGVTRQCLEHFKKYIYCSTLPDDNDALRPLLLIATQYLIDSLKTECTMKLLQTITAENLDRLVEFCAENGMDELLRSICETTPREVLAEGYVMRIKGRTSSGTDNGDAKTIKKA